MLAGALAILHGGGRFFRLVGHDFLNFFGDWWSCCGGWVDDESGFGVLVAAVLVVVRGDAERELFGSGFD